jgi:diguanylate cyclase (GGDEF)-like protein/PAS domain S-box-containing protein
MIDPGNYTFVEELVTRLATSEAHLRNVIERSPDAYIIIDRQGVIQFANHAAAVLFGAHPSVLTGQPFGFPIEADQTTDVDIVNPRGEDLIAEMRVVETEWGGNDAHIAVLRDITERRRSEQALRESEKRLALVMDASMLGFWDLDLRNNRLTCNDKLYWILGYMPGEIEQRSDAWVPLIFPDDLARARQAVGDHVRGKTSTFRVELRLRAKSGNWCWVLSQGEVVERDEGGHPQRIIGIIENIDERKDVEERIRHVSQHDVLTGLPNRALLHEFSEHVLSSARRGGNGSAFLFVDLDRFKPINDTYGHSIGDAILKEAAQRLAACVRAEDLVGRLGGDEFLTVLSHIENGEDAAKVARHALQSLDRPFHVEGIELRVSSSIGISLFPQDGQNVKDLINNADTAMYHAKESGRNNFQFFKREFNERASHALSIENGLHNGLEQEEFILFYQPLIDTETQAIVGAEALLRWPAMNAAPEQFIPVAEATGFMKILGEWVVQEACRQQRRWRDDGFLSFPVSINVSPTQFRQKSFVRSIGDAIAKAHLHPRDISLEVTESMLMRSVDEAAGVLHSLKELGVKVALDNFGTGYTCLHYLSRLPIDVLKLDQSFVKHLGREKPSLAIAEGVIALGQAFKMEIVAEGIESEEALGLLKARHCRRGRGFHFCRPLPAREFEQWCRTRMA